MKEDGVLYLESASFGCVSSLAELCTCLSSSVNVAWR